MEKPMLRLKRLGIDTYKEAIIYMRKDCSVCLSEGFEVYARVKVSSGERFIIATVNMISSNLLADGEAGLSEQAYHLLGANDGDQIQISHAKPVRSTRNSKFYQCNGRFRRKIKVAF